MKFMINVVSRVGFLVAALLPASGGDPVLRITSPTPGALVTPGGSLTIDVSSTREGVAAILAMLGGVPIGFKEVSGSSPFRITIQVPRTAKLGIGNLLVGGAIKGDSGPVGSGTVVVDVERTDAPERIRVTTPHLTLRPPGAHEELQVFGMYKDDGEVDISKSTRLSYYSESPDIASVSKDGRVTAISPGSTRIVINHHLSVDVTVPGIVQR